jgi:hypothetical protein
MLGVDAGLAGDRWDMLVNVFSEVAESVLADDRHKPSGEFVRPKSNLAARSARPAREVRGFAWRTGFRSRTSGSGQHRH